MQVKTNPMPRLRAVRPRFRVLELAAVLTLALNAAAGATAFRSYNGSFAIDIPAGWNQVDYRTADYHLKQIDADLTYEAVFSDGGGSTVFGDKYLILTVDTVGPLNASGIDSLLAVVDSEFNKSTQRYDGSNGDGYISEKYVDKVAYDTVHNVVSVVSTLWEDNVKRKNVLAMKIYDRGVANFYFYSPDSLYDNGLPDFRSFLASFTTDMSTKAKQQIKIADLKRGKETSFTIIFIGIAVALALIVFILLSRKKRQGKKRGPQS